jgi:hypothetical protein
MIINKNEVELLLEKAAAAEKSEDAMRFSQAACNAANAFCALRASGLKTMLFDPA